MAKSFVWKDEYKVGVDAIDAQHLESFEIAERILEAEHGRNIKDGLTKFYCHELNHFVDEEKYMEEIGYPGLKEHARQHDDLIHQLNELMRSIARDPTKLQEIRFFLVDWFEHHVQTEDQKIREFVNGSKTGGDD